MKIFYNKMNERLFVWKSCWDVFWSLVWLKGGKTEQKTTNPVCEKFSIRPLEGMTNDGYYVGVSEPN